MFITFDREIIFMKFSQIVYNINEIMLNEKLYYYVYYYVIFP